MDCNPHVTIQATLQNQFMTFVCMGAVNDSLVGPYVLPAPFTGAVYKDFIPNICPNLLEDVLLLTRRRLWLMNDAAPAHFRNIVRHAFSDICV